VADPHAAPEIEWLDHPDRDNREERHHRCRRDVDGRTTTPYATRKDLVGS
jgi:hypothetical protein